MSDDHGRSITAILARGVKLASTTCVLAVCTVAAARAHATTLTLWGAGSLSGAFGTVARDFTSATGIAVTMRFGPSGSLRADIEAGARPDLFASADLAGPRALHAAGLAGPVADFTSNRFVAIVAPGFGVTSANLLSKMLDPAVRLGTSTPVDDPGSDYAEQVFARADAIVPGAKAALDAKAERLVGSPSSPPVPAGQNSLVYYLDVTHQADIFLACHTSALAAEAIDPDLQAVSLPPDLALPPTQFGLTVLNGTDPDARELESYILSAPGQAVLASYGFGPPAPVSEPASAAMLGIALVGLVAARSRRNRPLRGTARRDGGGVG